MLREQGVAGSVALLPCPAGRPTASMSHLGGAWSSNGPPALGKRRTHGGSASELWVPLRYRRPGALPGPAVTTSPAATRPAPSARVASSVVVPPGGPRPARADGGARWRGRVVTESADTARNRAPVVRIGRVRRAGGRSNGTRRTTGRCWWARVALCWRGTAMREE